MVLNLAVRDRNALTANETMGEALIYPKDYLQTEVGDSS
jgi:hypothetical protein